MVKERLNDPRVLFGRRLRELRIARHLSQELLAEQAGLDRTYVSGCERGKRIISIVNIYKLAAAIKTDPMELLKRPAK
jgi:transcriptional regulator with XRE-family HTH domain